MIGARGKGLSITAGIAANRPSAVANSASAMPGATTARLVFWAPKGANPR